MYILRKMKPPKDTGGFIFLFQLAFNISMRYIAYMKTKK